MSLTRTGNKILDRLAHADLHQLAPRIERVTHSVGEVVAHPGTPPPWVYFPVSGVLSSMVILEDGSTVEASTIGNEGMDGLYLLVDALENPYRVLVQVPGAFIRIRAAAFKNAMGGSAALSHLLTRYALVLIQRGAQNAACVQHHTVGERMCRWLLETAQRAGSDNFNLTQEFLSDMLGVRRQSVNATARLLQKAGLIEYRRGDLRILDRAALEESSCECFKVSQEMYEGSMSLRSP